MDFSLCPYKDIFGDPNTGVHQYKIFDISIVDTGLMIGVALLISKYYEQDFKLVLLILFMLGIILHNLFCVESTVNKFLFR
jgi:hypothetical protein